MGAIDSLSALKRGLPVDDQRAWAQRLVIGDGFARIAVVAGDDDVRQGRLNAAVNTYDQVAKHAAAAGWPALQGQALLRTAALWSELALVQTRYAPAAQRALATLRATTDPAIQPNRDASVLIEARLAKRRGDGRQLDRLLAQAGTLKVDRPTLVTAPAIDLQIPSTCSEAGAQQVHPEVDDQWVDVAFRVTPEGRVADIVEQRRGKHAGGRWLDLSMRSLAGRRYVPLTLPADSPVLARLERFIVLAEFTPFDAQSDRRTLWAAACRGVRPDGVGREGAQELSVSRACWPRLLCPAPRRRLCGSEFKVGHSVLPWQRGLATV